ncbi:MAG TPA: hypothetical protein VMJ10_32600 [Kofleriaceae bacterium]|nr:hypothetical protein [Kofleriaceae bacterium]
MGFFAGIAHVLGGKGELRLIIQPLVAIALGVRLGIADARERRAPFGVRVVHSDHHVRFALSDIIVPFCIALVVDAVLQHYTLGYVRPLAAVLVAALIVWLPYSIARGLANRMATRHASGRTAPSSP